MTVIQFPLADRAEQPVAVAGTAVEGRFRSPRGRSGRFVGSYRLEACARLEGRLVVTGVFGGELMDGDGDLVGLAARRRTGPARITHLSTRTLVRVAPVEVDLLGFGVTFPEVVVVVPARVPGWPGLGLVPVGHPLEALDARDP